MGVLQKTSKILKSNGLKQYSTAIHWDIGGLITTRITADWKCWKEDIEPRYCANAILNETNRMKKGIVLFHDVDERSLTLTIMMVQRWKDAGYQFVRLDDVLDAENLKPSN